MSGGTDDTWWYCLKHQRVEPDDGCANTHRLGPYPDRASAEHALDTVHARNEKQDAEDAEWEN